MFDRSARIEFEGVDIKDIEDLRIVFDVDKNDGLQFNHGNIVIYNLSRENRAKIARPYPLGYPMIEPIIKVSLYAGYVGNEVLILSGDILSATNEKRGPEWMTTIDIYSGLDDSTKADAQVSFAIATDAKVVADKLLSELGIDIKYTPDALAEIQNKKTSDFAASGLAANEATTFLARYGLAFTIEENGQGLVYVDERPRNPDAAKSNDNTFKPTNGLLGTPKITRSGVEIKSLLRPRLKLFERIFVESETTKGSLQASPDYSPDYHIIGLRHVGDTRGDDWFTEIECAYSKLSEGVY